MVISGNDATHRRVFIVVWQFAKPVPSKKGLKLEQKLTGFYLALAGGVI